MEMFESDDYIIQLGEDGRYMVESMSTWKPGTRICNVIRWGGSPRTQVLCKCMREQLKMQHLPSIISGQRRHHCHVGKRNLKR